MASTFTMTKVGKTEVKGTEKVVRWTLDCTSYDNDDAGGDDGIRPTLAQLGLKKLTWLEVKCRELKYMAVWDGSMTAPVITIHGQEPTSAGAGIIPFTEESNATDVGIIELVAYGK